VHINVYWRHQARRATIDRLHRSHTSFMIAPPSSNSSRAPPTTRFPARHRHGRRRSSGTAIGITRGLPRQRLRTLLRCHHAGLAAVADGIGGKCGRFAPTTRVFRRSHSPGWRVVRSVRTNDDDPGWSNSTRLFARVACVQFFWRAEAGLLSCECMSGLLKSVKYDHGKHFSSVLIEFGLNPARS